MPSISKLAAVVGIAWTDLLVGVFGGATDKVSLQQLRDFFGMGTNIIFVPTYPVANQADPALGKNGDLILCNDTNRLYKKANDAFPPINQPTGVFEGTRVKDSVIATDTSWSSQQIDSYIRGAVAVVMDLAPNVARRVPFFSKVLLESLRVTFGPDSFQVRLLLPDGTLITTAAGTGAACIGQVSASITNLTAAQVALGYNVEFTNTGNAVLTAQLRTIPVS